MIKTVIFDLDGVLVDAKSIHYEALNKALDEDFKISLEEHLSIYDGLKTNEKLLILTEKKGLNPDFYKNIFDKKQKYTLEMLSHVQENENLIELFSYLKQRGIKIVVASNSIRDTVIIVLKKLNLQKYVDCALSNEDVVFSKPHPEIYWKSMMLSGSSPYDTLIVEDSPFGLEAAYASNAHVIRVISPKDVNINNIGNKINNINKVKKMNKISKWENKKMNILIPMAGEGSRFANAGYTFPKPLIDVNGKPMIQVVIENLNIDANFIFIVRKEHRAKYNLDNLLNILAPGCSIVETDKLTEGAACTSLLAKNFIDNDNPLFFANSDQFVEWSSTEFFYKMQETDIDGSIVTFESTHPKWSFAKVNDSGLVIEVAEKNPISTEATVGFYYWKHGRDFVKYAERMIDNNIRVNGEFYVCPVFNEAIKDNLKISTFRASKMYGIGTPEDLQYFLQNHNV